MSLPGSDLPPSEVVERGWDEFMGDMHTFKKKNEGV